MYLDLAQENGGVISHIFETHLHADHLSRARTLAERVGAEFTGDTLFLTSVGRPDLEAGANRCAVA